EIQESHATPDVTEHHNVLPYETGAQREVAQFIRKANRLPEAAQVFPARRSGAAMREFCVFLGDIAVIIAAKACGQKGGAGCHIRSPLHLWGGVTTSTR